MTVEATPLHDDDAGRLFPLLDRIFALLLVLEVAAFALFPFLPLVVAAAALTTRVRHSRWRMVILWIFAAILSIVSVAPFILGLFDFNFVENGPVNTVSVG